MESGFRFIAERVISIPGRGVVVTGEVESGSVSVGTEIEFLATDGKWANALVMAIEVSRHLVEEAKAGNRANILLEGVRKDQIALGTVLLKEPAAAPSLPSSPSEAQTPSVAYPPSAPSFPTFPKAIHPSSSLWRTVLFVVIGILLVLILLYLQGK